MRENRFCMVLVMLICMGSLTGCWNYKEVEQLAIVSGAALDKNEDGSISLLIEVVNVKGDGQIAYEPAHIEVHGRTFFEAVRRGITLEGRKLYWSHAKAFIISQELAKEDIVKYLDFLFRDPETREDAWLLVSTEKTAAEILKTKPRLDPMVSFSIDDAMRSQRAISRFPLVELFEFFDRLFYKQVAPILPTIHLATQGGKPSIQIEGTAIIKDKKMIGTLNAEDTKSMLWLRDEVKGGIVVIENVVGTGDDVSLEIFKSKSKITPVIEDETLKMNADIELIVNNSEILGDADFTTSEGLQKLGEVAEKQIEEDIKKSFYLIRDQYKADVFGFGRRFEMKLPHVWNQIKEDWNTYFAELELDVKVKVKVRGPATTRVPLKAEE